MLHTYERLLIKLDRLIEKEKTAKSHFVEKDVAYQKAKAVFEKESEDVERIESQSFSSFLRSVIGTYEKKRDKEKEEMVQAKMHLDMASALLLEAREDLVTISEQVTELKNEIDNMREELLANDAYFQEMVSEEEHKRLEWNQEIEEIDEALAAGTSVLNGLDHVLNSLESADSLATWDLFSDSFIIDMMKYNKIDSAEKDMMHLEGLIESYRKELKDVHLETALEYERHDQMSRVFDVFFDNIFSDWNTKDKIQRNIDSLGRMEREVQEIQETLINHRNDLIEKIQTSEVYY